MRIGGVGPGALAVAVIAVVATLASCTAPAPDATAPRSTAPDAGSPAANSAPAITVPTASLGKDVATRLADGVTPPTNRWYSSLAFGDPGLPVFPKPLAFTPVEGGFTMGLTRPTASAAAIIGAASADVSVTIAGASGFGTVTRANPVGVGLSFGDAGVSLAQGWPVVGVTADASVALELGTPFAVAGDVDGAEAVGYLDVRGATYGVVVRGGSLDGATISLDAGGSAQFFAVPAGGAVESFAAALGEPVGEVTWQGTADGASATTTLDYGTETAVTMPAARAEDIGLDCSLGTYDTIDGEFAVCAAQTVTWSVPPLAPTARLGLDALSGEQRAEVASALTADVKGLSALPSDSYFGGKALYRIANLLTIAEGLGDAGAAETLRIVLWDALREWGDAERCAEDEARCFVYDPGVRGIVGVTPAFGSEDFNDHHFHYGYLLYAAAVAAAEDPELATDIGPVFDQVAADIASGADSGSFPAIRAFDPVAGHSWASGYAPFGDANNQESSSEAVSAWNAVALWGAVRGDAGLEERGAWMLAAEADAARRLWLDPDLSAFPEYEHDIVAIEWGGKRDYATWFSAEPPAMLGIQLIPMAPFAGAYLRLVDSDTARASLAEAAPAGYGVMFGDYLLMYAAASGTVSSAEAWDTAVALPATSIDDGNSRTYMLAWLAALAY